MPKRIVFFVTLILLIASAIIEEDTIIYYGHFVYLIQFTFITSSLLRYEKNYRHFLSPSFLTLAYICLSFTMGQYVVSRGIDFNLRYYNAFVNYQSVRFITIFFLLCNLTVFLAMPLNKLESTTSKPENIQNFKVKNTKIFFLLSLLFILSFVEVDLGFIGGKGDFSYSLKFGIAILLAFLLSHFNGYVKYLYYFVIIILFIIGSYDSKREILYVIILFVVFEFVKRDFRIKLRLKQLLFFLGMIFLVIYIILISSLMRGYGNYNVDNPFDASKYVLDYVNSDIAVFGFVNNFELSTVYGNSSNAINYIYSGEEDLKYGSTFAKFIFLPVPRDLFPDKPDSMIEIYTRKFAPELRADGKSLPIVIYSEAYWNFDILGILFLFIFYRWFNLKYIQALGYIERNEIKIGGIFIIYMYITFIQFVRGSGLEQWLLYALLALPLAFVLIKILGLNKISNNV